MWLGLLLLVPLLWIVLSVFEVQRGAFAVTSAARSAARAYALADTDAAGREQARAADPAGAGRPGRRRPGLPLRRSAATAGCHEAGSVVTVRVWHGVDLPLLPGLLGGDAPSFRLDSTHTVPVGQFRDTG